MKKILWIIPILFLVFIVILINRSGITFSGYEKREDIRQFGDYEVEVTSSAQYIYPDGKLDGYNCTSLLRNPSKNSTITVTNLKTNDSKKYFLTGKDTRSRITLGGWFTDPTNELTVIGVNYQHISTDCYSKKYQGLIVVNNQGQLFPLNLPAEQASSDVELTSEETGESVVILLVPSDADLTTSDFNADSYSDFFITERINDEINKTKATMFDTKSNGPAQWFNNGESVFSSLTKEEINDTFISRREFILQQADMDELNENPIFRATQQSIEERQLQNNN